MNAQIISSMSSGCGQGGVSIKVRFVSFDEFLEMYRVDELGKGIVSIHLNGQFQKGQKIEVMLSVGDNVHFLNCEGAIVGIAVETIDTPQILHVALNNANEQGERLLSRLIEIMNQKNESRVYSHERS